MSTIHDRHRLHNIIYVYKKMNIKYYYIYKVVIDKARY